MFAVPSEPPQAIVSKPVASNPEKLIQHSNVKSLLEKLNHMVIDNKALMLVVNIMYRGLLSHNH